MVGTQIHGGQPRYMLAWPASRPDAGMPVRPGRFSHDLLRWASRTAWAPPLPEGCIAGSVAPPDLRCAANDVRGGSYAPRSPCILELSFPWCVGSGGQRACRIRPMSQCRHLATVARVDSLWSIRTRTSLHSEGDFDSDSPHSHLSHVVFNMIHQLT